MAIYERIVLTYNDKGSKQALKDLQKLENNFKDFGKKIAIAFGVAAAAAGAFAVKIGKDAVEGAIEDQKAQVALATALRNTINATDEQIKSTTEYLDALELQVGINNSELIPSLQKLTQATGSLEQAQALQSLALDVSAGSGKSLMQVTDGLVRAFGGNLGALKKLGINLDETIIKEKDLNGALAALSATFGGQALKRAETFEFQIERLRLQFDQTLDSLGYALLPVLEELATIFRNDLLPAFEQFIANNKDQIAETFRGAAQFAVKATKAFIGFFKTINDNLTAFKAFAAIITGLFIGTKVYAGIQLVISALTLLTSVFRKQAVAGTAAGTALAFATGGTSALAAAAAVTAFAAAAGTAYWAINKFTSGIDTNTKAVSQNSQVVNNHLQDLKKVEKAVADYNFKNRQNVVITNNLNKKTKEQIQLEKALAALKKLGVKPTTEKDPIQLEAARLNLLKQANLEEARRVNQLIENLEAQMKLNEAAQRYTDLLQVLSDAQISDEEVSVLASKWNLTKNEVLEYIARIYASNSTDINDGPIVNLLMKWGLTKDEAEKYVDFTRALKDEKIDDAEIEELMGKWGMTRAEVVAYGKEVQDGSALQKTLSKTFALPGDDAAAAWKRALDALNAYLAALKGVPGGGGVGGGVKGGTVTTSPDVITPAVERIVTPIAENIKTLETLRESTDKGTAINFLLKEQIDELNANLTKPTVGPIVDERTRMAAMAAMSSTTPDIGSFRMADNAGMTVNVTVQGSVQTEADLAEAIRNRFLLEQQSGKPIQFIGGL